MLTTRSIRGWAFVHRWTSLVCTVFLLMLCITGLPLIFHHEIETFSDHARPATLPPGTPRADLDAVLSAAQAKRPGWVPQYLLQEPDQPDRLLVTLIEKPDADPDSARNVIVDARTAEVLGEPDEGSGFMAVMHTTYLNRMKGKSIL